ncbi:MAG: LLM class F420-dependent oxidoreductase [Actinobacteria bacterium]|nr:MAG: LLM class F420-dependent oxidoreductase [Actinomycetota bacterium]
MKLGLSLGYWGATPTDFIPLVVEAERLGFDSVWSAEAYGSDAVTLITWAAAHTERIGLGTSVMQIPARTPAATAMTAITLDHLSGGRFRLGLGVSGPQVSEGWHGVPFDRPLQRTREYVEVVRAILRREKPVEHHGEFFDVPLRGGTGLGKPLKTIVHPLRPDLPIYLAAIGPKNVALAAEVADGWLPTFYSPNHQRVFEPALAEGLAASGRDRSELVVAPFVPIVVGQDLQACRDVIKPILALYVGGMGARGRNFYNDLIRRYGYEAAATRIQDLYLEGRKGEAAGAVPDRLVDEVALAGPAARVAEQLGAWRSAGVDLLIVGAYQPEALRVVAEAAF